MAQELDKCKLCDKFNFPDRNMAEDFIKQNPSLGLKRSYPCPHIRTNFHVTSKATGMGHKSFKITDDIIQIMKDQYKYHGTIEFTTKSLEEELNKRNNRTKVNNNNVSAGVRTLKKQGRLVETGTEVSSGRGRNFKCFALKNILEQATDPKTKGKVSKEVATIKSETPKEVAAAKPTPNVVPDLKTRVEDISKLSVGISKKLDDIGHVMTHSVQVADNEKLLRTIERKQDEVIQVMTNAPVANYIVNNLSQYFSEHAISLSKQITESRHAIENDLKCLRTEYVNLITFNEWAEVFDGRLRDILSSTKNPSTTFGDYQTGYRDGMKDGIKMARELNMFEG